MPKHDEPLTWVEINKLERILSHCDLNEYELWERALNELKTLRGKYTSDKHTVYRS